MANHVLVADVRSDHINVNGECNVCSAGRWAFKWPCESVRLADEVDRLSKLIEAKDEYILALENELVELEIFAMSRGWRSSNIEDIGKIRAKIAAITEVKE